MEGYINGIGIISPQKTFATDDFLSDIQEHNTNYIRCIEPSYKAFFDPIQARRMGRIIKMSILASDLCLKEAGITQPDAIITGTALGCHEETEKFLTSILDNDEQFLTPTAFIQSTHNTVSAQIALHLKCMNYNFTFVHKGFSFETALTDALMTLKEGEAEHILVGAHEEITQRHFSITRRVGYWKEGELIARDLLHSATPGSTAGEGAAFFVLSKKPGTHNYARLDGLKMLYRPEGIQTIRREVEDLLQSKGLKPQDIDIVVYGNSGDVRYDGIYNQLREELFPGSTSAWFKHLCGEYQTSSGFALYAAAKILATQTIPPALLIGEKKHDRIRNVLIYNTSMNVEHCIYLLSRV